MGARQAVNFRYRMLVRLDFFGRLNQSFSLFVKTSSTVPT
jgi:hypothetical protein